MSKDIPIEKAIRFKAKARRVKRIDRPDQHYFNIPLNYIENFLIEINQEYIIYAIAVEKPKSEKVT